MLDYSWSGKGKRTENGWCGSRNPNGRRSVMDKSRSRRRYSYPRSGERVTKTETSSKSCEWSCNRRGTIADSRRSVLNERRSRCWSGDREARHSKCRSGSRDKLLDVNRRRCCEGRSSQGVSEPKSCSESSYRSRCGSGAVGNCRSREGNLTETECRSWSCCNGHARSAKDRRSMLNDGRSWRRDDVLDVDRCLLDEGRSRCLYSELP